MQHAHHASWIRDHPDMMSATWRGGVWSLLTMSQILWFYKKHKKKRWLTERGWGLRSRKLADVISGWSLTKKTALESGYRFSSENPSLIKIFARHSTDRFRDHAWGDDLGPGASSSECYNRRESKRARGSNRVI